MRGYVSTAARQIWCQRGAGRAWRAVETWYVHRHLYCTELQTVKACDLDGEQPSGKWPPGQKLAQYVAPDT